MATTPQGRVEARDAAQRALDDAVLAYRDDPTPERYDAGLAAARAFVTASQGVIADELIEQQRNPARLVMVSDAPRVPHCTHWEEGDGPCHRCGLPNWCTDRGEDDPASRHAYYDAPSCKSDEQLWREPRS